MISGAPLILQCSHSLEFKSPWSLGEVLKKSLNSIFPQKVLRFLWKVLENWGFIFVFFKWFLASEVNQVLSKWNEKCRELGGTNSSSPVRMDWECAFCVICEVTFLVGGPWNVHENSLKNGGKFLFEPCLVFLARVSRPLTRCYTGQFATTIFSATQCCYAGTML